MRQHSPLHVVPLLFALTLACGFLTGGASVVPVTVVVSTQPPAQLPATTESQAPTFTHLPSICARLTNPRVIQFSKHHPF